MMSIATIETPAPTPTPTRRRTAKRNEPVAPATHPNINMKPIRELIAAVSRPEHKDLMRRFLDPGLSVTELTMRVLIARECVTPDPYDLDARHAHMTALETRRNLGLFDRNCDSIMPMAGEGKEMPNTAFRRIAAQAGGPTEAQTVSMLRDAISRMAGFEAGFDD